VAPVDVRPAEGERANVLTVSLFSRGDCCGAFLITVPGRFPVEVALAIEDLAGQLSLALESASLTDEIHRQRHERRFRVLVEYSSDLVGVLNRDGILTFVSPASSRLLGLAAADLLGRSIMERVHPHDHGKVARILGSARYAGGAADPMELRLLHSDGRWRWFEVVVNDAADEPDVRGLVIHARDVTDRKSAELRVAESEARFRSLVQNASDLVMVVGEDGAIAYVSPSVTRVLGYSAEQLLGSSWLELVARADTAHAARVVGATLPGEPSTLELRARSAAGCYVHLELIVSDLRAEPVVAGLVVNARNVTERRESEERWRAFGIEASHQLRTPLTGLRLSLENLVDGPSATRAALQDALAHVDRLQSTVEDFLAIAPRRVAPVEPLDVDAVLEDIEASWRPLVLVAGRRLVVKVDGPLPVVVASAAAVRQVLGVLIDNALQHGTGCIGVAARRLVGGLALEVSDEGRGLGTPGSGPAHLNRDGNGMGLSLARSLAEAEGGRLVAGRAKSSPAVALVLPSRLTYPEEGLTGRAGIRHHAQ
jgi:PAS domain S-box-containing protein